MPLGLGFGEMIVMLVVLFLTVLPAWRVVTKAGYPGALSLLMLVPVVNFIALHIFAFLEWPLERRAASVPRPPA